MYSFCAEQCWVCADVSFLGLNSDAYTFVSEAHDCRRWLVCFDVYWTDHFPLKVECNIDQLGLKRIGNQPLNKIM